MGYDVHITRRQHLYDEDSPTITESEWEHAVATTPAMAEFAYFDGDEIVCKNPDEEQLQILVDVAKRLNANLIGDDDERYRLTSSGAVVDDRPARQRISWGQSLLRVGLALIVVWGIMFLILWILGAFR